MCGSAGSSPEREVRKAILTGRQTRERAEPIQIEKDASSDLRIAQVCESLPGLPFRQGEPDVAAHALQTVIVERDVEELEECNAPRQRLSLRIAGPRGDFEHGASILSD